MTDSGLVLAIGPELHTTIRPANRQLARRAQRGKVTCCRCGGTQYDPSPDGPFCVVFDNTRAGHRRCAEHINEIVDEMNLTAARDRLIEAGVELPEFELILPPGA